MDIINMTALEIADNLKNKNISCIEVTNAFLDNIDRLDKNYNCFITIDSENAIKRAKAIQERIDKNISTSVLAGVPIAIKDNICTKGIRTSCASKMLSDFTPFYNASVVDKILDNDMIILGKTNMDEFAMGSTTQTSFYGATKNPYDSTLVPGGSSGGSACAVAIRESPLALGSDTGGSIRQPSAFCGITGFKPTYSSVSRYGLVAYASSLEQIGPMGNNILDVATLYSIIKGKDNKDNTSKFSPEIDFNKIKDANVGNYKIAVIKEFMDSWVNSEIKDSILKSIDVYKNLGCEIEEISIDFADYLVPTYYILACGQASSNLSRYDGIRYGYCDDVDNLDELYKANRTKGFGSEVKKRIMLGNFVLSSGYFDDYYKKALSIKCEIKHKLNVIFEKFNAIIMPSTPNLPYSLDIIKNDKMALYQDDIMSVLANLTGVPAISIPCGMSKGGLPIGMQIISKAYSENDLFTLTNAFQNQTNYHLQKPPVIKGVD